MQLPFGPYFQGTPDFEEVLECEKCLLEAGCDPCAPAQESIDDSIRPYLYYLLLKGTIVSSASSLLFSILIYWCLGRVTAGAGFFISVFAFK